jgi:hypothetical protein
MRDLVRAQTVFGDLDVRYWQAPFKLPRPPESIPAAAYVHLLQNTGFRNFDEIAVLSAAWRAVYEAVRPDLIVFEHSPMALLAARGYDARRVVCGSGFFCPPAGLTLPTLRTRIDVDLELVRQDEEQVLSLANRLLESQQQPPLGTLGDLYHDVDDTFLTTLAELDHFGPREDTRYWGVAPFAAGEPFQWPTGTGPRIYSYLRPSQVLEPLCNCSPTGVFQR